MPSYLDVNNVTLLVDVHVCWQRNGACEVNATKTMHYFVHFWWWFSAVLNQMFSTLLHYLLHSHSPCLRNCRLNMYRVPLLLPLVFVMISDYWKKIHFLVTIEGISFILMRSFTCFKDECILIFRLILSIVYYIQFNLHLYVPHHNEVSHFQFKYDRMTALQNSTYCGEKQWQLINTNRPD